MPRHRTKTVNDVIERFHRLDLLCRTYGLSLKEWRLLNCCLDGQMTDAEIIYSLSLSRHELDDLLEQMHARSLVGRRRGKIIASIEGRAAYYRVPSLAA
jgi:DNA-binding MarR family transcriptional regulator